MARFQKFLLALISIAGGILCAIYIPFDNKDILGWLIGAFTTFGGLLLAVMTLAGHSLTLLQDQDWKALQLFKDTYSTRIQFSALLSFLLLLTVLFLVITYLSYRPYLQYISGFLSGMCFIYILYLPFYLSKMYLEYYDFIIKKQKG